MDYIAMFYRITLPCYYGLRNHVLLDYDTQQGTNQEKNRTKGTKGDRFIWHACHAVDCLVFGVQCVGR